MRYARLEYAVMRRDQCLFPGTAPSWRPACQYNSYSLGPDPAGGSWKVREFYFWFRGAQYHLKLQTRRD